MSFLFKRKKDGASGQIQTGRNLGRQPVRGFNVPIVPSDLGGKAAQGTRDRQPLRRTPPPVAQSKAFSYYANRSQTELNTGRESSADKPVQRRVPGKLHKLRTHAGWVAGSMLLLAAVLYQMQLSSSARVVSLIPTSDAPFLQDTKVYEEAAGKLFSTSVTNRNKMTVNTSAIAEELQSQYPELRSVTVSLPMLGDTPVIHVRPADPALVLVTADETFVVDADGRALSEARSAAQLNRLQIPTVTDQSGLSFKLGDQALPRKTTAFIQTVARQYRAQDIAVKAMTLPAAASELDVYLADQPYYVKFNIQDSAENAAELQSGTYAAVRKHLEAKGITPADYIDVRLQGRAYYK